MVRHLICEGMKIGHGQIDAEHQDLLDKLLHCADLAKISSYEDVKSAFHAFREQLAQHVDNEEGIMLAFGYDKIARDTAVHEQGLRELDDLLKLYLTPGNWNSENGEDLVLKITTVLVELFLKSDLGFKGHLQNIDYRGA